MPLLPRCDDGALQRIEFVRAGPGVYRLENLIEHIVYLQRQLARGHQYNSLRLCDFPGLLLGSLSASLMLVGGATLP